MSSFGNKNTNCLKRLKIGIVAVALLIVFCFSINSNTERQIKNVCFGLKRKHIYVFDDIMQSPPRLNKTIFFHDTSCTNDSIVSLNSRYFFLVCEFLLIRSWNFFDSYKFCSISIK